ncbi:MAG TPA: 3-hydroxyacyl-CoA dehydrogenase NAD-binding domain-containing protein [Chitinophagales bacterium]|nr:3-hydroxyacyl-CoA dehydrogenase NAD-binding domain-containing protein [Chitinophagales bacterium]HNG71072.1 3-hydroxyacyl-CoA dehydrogenase NAD-binding domain-containing protein [Chitinophagales bacterium]HNI32162.1 3-hydroxyacyl-CoA dehydrogenase NAD-binding domain-containing protein [Chitinophagales bacterium]HNK73902.1 3-hydroxyacyl-CoA dehydrogenase NAD-binding domain-containing protein [Chitinophagales bacterium]HNL56425.1 3-hydroxyacyl-CoA dehydrogenase NAD-binding domain-containing pr
MVVLKREDYISIEKNSNGVCTIWMDQKDEKINKIGPDLIGLFESVFEELNADDSIKAFVLSSKKKDFIAGADIDAFAKVEKPGDWKPIARKGHEILNQIEKSKKPIVAAIHGNALGAGLEIAMACHARVLSNDKSTKVALPEVKLGLLPGGGGTQRLPRLVGLQAALDMMLTGKNVFAYPALKMGLADKVVHVSALQKVAQKFALELVDNPIKRERNELDIKAGFPSIQKSLTNIVLEAPLVNKIVFDQAKKMVDKQAHGNYPAPYKIMECVEIGWNQGIEKGYEAEVDRFEELILSPVSRQLINIFFAMTDKKKNPYGEDKVKQVDRLGMIGAGFMGAGIAEVSMNDGMHVLLKDINQDMISSAYKTIYDGYNKRVSKKAMSKIELEEKMALLSGSLNYEDLDNQEIIIEAVFEDLKLKQAILKDVEANAKPNTIFATNTSALPIKHIAANAKHPELVIGMHYFSPVPKMPLLEIVKTDKTADWVIATCYDVGVRQGKTVIVVHDGPGFYTTRILAPLMNEAQLLLDEGGDIQQIDREMNLFGFPVGPITLADEVGIDVGAHIMSGELMQELLSTRPKFKVSKTLLEISKAGYKGRKNKKGFYKYDEKGKKVSGQVDADIYSFYGGNTRKKFDANDIHMRCAMAMVNEAALCLQENIIESPLDGDIGAVFGLGFPPFRGGPFRYIDSVGAQKVVDILNDLTARFGERFEPAQILLDYAKSGKKFYDK